MKPLILIDGSWCLHRAFHVFRQFEYGGTKTGTIYGLIRDVMLLAERFQTDDIHVAWDSRSFRKDLNENYKANRVREEGDSPYDNIDIVMEALSYAGIPSYQQEGYEADDIIFTLTRAIKDDEKAVIFASDKDLYQCLKPNVKVLRGHKDELYGLENFEEEFGFPFSIENYILYKSVVGDGSDNIKGIHRFPKKELRAYLNGEEMNARGKKLFEEGQDIIESNTEIFELHDLNITFSERPRISKQGIEKIKTLYGVKQLWTHEGSYALGINEYKKVRVKL